MTKKEIDKQVRKTQKEFEKRLKKLEKDSKRFSAKILNWNF